MARSNPTPFFLLFLLGACTFAPVTPVRPNAEVIATEIFEQLPDPAVDVLFIIDDSGSMAEEQFNLMANLTVLVEALQQTRASLRFATVTTNPNGEENAAGRFFQHPRLENGALAPNRDIIGSQGRLRDIPDDFCDAVLAASQNGVLDPQSQALIDLLDQNGVAGDLDPSSPGLQIPDFTGRFPGTSFVDLDGDQIPESPNQIITAEFTDAVGCIIAVGVRGFGMETGLCKAAAALDEESLSGDNSAFLNNPDSLLALIFVGDEDDCTLNMIREDGGRRIRCESAPLTSIGSLKCALPSSQNNICNTGIAGSLDALTPIEELAAEIKKARGGDDRKLFVATVTGPPEVAIADCGSRLPIPSCENEETGIASPGNRFFLFAKQFANSIDSFSDPAEPPEERLPEGICSNFGQTIQLITNSIIEPLLPCLNAPIESEPGAFVPERDMRVTIDISSAEGVSSCADIRAQLALPGESCAQEGDPVTEPDEENPALCIVRRDPDDGIEFLAVEESASCNSGFAFVFQDFIPPNRSIVSVEYLSHPQ